MTGSAESSSTVLDALTQVVKSESVRRAGVIGLASTGICVAEALMRAGVEVVVVDEAPGEVASANAASLAERFGYALCSVLDRGAARDPAIWGSLDLLVPSPGVPPRSPAMQAASRAASKVWSEVELAYRVVELLRGDGRRRTKLVAVTGTNGKTTTASLIGHMLEYLGIDTVVCGNIGYPMLEAVLAHPDVGVLVAEVSSFQLRYTHAFAPDVAVFLNFAEDHLDWHPSVEDYAASKARIFCAQRPGHYAVYYADDPVVTRLAKESMQPGVVSLPFTTCRPTSGLLYVAGRRVVEPDGRIRPIPNANAGLSERKRAGGTSRVLDADIAAALCAVVALGGSVEQALDSLDSFRPAPHRLEFVKTVAGRNFVDDSKATNPHAALMALDEFETVVLIAGGRNKGLDMQDFAARLASAQGLRGIVCIGEVGPELADASRAHGVAAEVASSMEEAVWKAFGMSLSGDTVLLSPGCASFDWYSNYEERGRAFEAAVASLEASLEAVSEVRGQIAEDQSLDAEGRVR